MKSKKVRYLVFLGHQVQENQQHKKILIKLLDKYDGMITYNNKNILELGEEFYENIGVSFEMPIHFSKMTAMENIEFFLKGFTRKQNDVESLMKKVKVFGKTKIKWLVKYSKGMKIRLTL